MTKARTAKAANLKLERLFLRHFRNYQRLDLQLSPRLNILIGANGAGKTNALEAIFLLATGQSQRTHRDADMIQWEAGHFYVKGRFKSGRRSLTLELAYGKNEGKAGKVNEKKQQSLSDFRGRVPVVLFVPDHLRIVKEGPHERRAFLDQELGRFRPQYQAHLDAFALALRQRNDLLKNIQRGRSGRDLLAVWDTQLVEAAVPVVLERQQMIQQLSPLVTAEYHRLTGREEALVITYQPPVSLDAVEHEAEGAEERLAKQLHDQLQAARDGDIDRGYTRAGPHRDDLRFLLGEHNLRSFGSQGQQRTAVLALKLAELSFGKALTGENPLFLLDDVLSELDSQRSQRLLLRSQDGAQTILTSADPKQIPDVSNDASWYHVERGTIQADGKGSMK